MSVQPKAVIVDVGIGNILSVSRACEAVGGYVQRTNDPSRIAGADRLIVPGVGAFGDCMKAFNNSGLAEPLRAFAGSGRPMLGVCVGMQMLMSVGEEFGETPGLDLIPGRVKGIPHAGPDGRRHKIPHIGWNAIRPPSDAASNIWENGLFSTTPKDTPVYFVHSFAAYPQDRRDLLAVCTYNGVEIAAAIGRENVMGTQFHPEKSGTAGLQTISRFFEL